MSVPEQPEIWVWLAQIRRPQGRKGEVFAAILTDFPEKFAERKRLWLVAADEAGPTPATGAPGPSHSGTRETISLHQQARPVELIAHWPHKGGIVLHFAGVDSISEAEGLSGLLVAIPHAERAPLGEDEVYIGDLVGCVLMEVSGESPLEIGPIEDVDRTAGPTPLLVVRGAKGEVLVPFAKSYLRKIDLERKCVEMALPEGLVDLNAREKD
jgi:16S rRNA processing protein RimM